MMSDAFTLLIVDDEPNIRSGLARGLTAEADVVDTADQRNDFPPKRCIRRSRLIGPATSDNFAT